MGSFFLLSLLLLIFSINKTRVFFILSFFILVILAGFRDFSVGTDTLSYQMLFERTRAGVEIRTEWLWAVLSKIVIYFGGGFTALLVTAATMVLLPVYFVAKKFSVNASLSIFFYYTLYFYFFSFNITRQMIAVSIVLLAFAMLQQNKKTIFGALIFIAAGFHLTALTAIPLMYLDRLPNNNRFYFVSVVMSMILGLFLSGFIFSFGAGLLGYGRYVESYSLGESLVGQFLYLVILNSFFFFIMLGVPAKETLFRLFFVFIIVSNLVISIPFGERVVLYYAIIQVLFLPYFLKVSRYKPKEVALIIVLLYTYAMYFRRFGAGEILPYLNVLF